MYICYIAAKTHTHFIHAPAKYFIFIWLFCLSQPKLRRPFDRGRGIFNGMGGGPGRSKLHPIVHSMPERSWTVGQPFQVLLIQLCKSK